MDDLLKDVPVKYKYELPEYLIGVDLMDELTKHYKKTYRCKSYEEMEKAIHGIPVQTRKEIADAYHRLRESGWRPSGLDKHDRVIWARCIIGVQADPSPMSPEKIKAERERIRKLKTSVVGSFPECEPYDYHNKDQLT
jgi:hypothetical protein